MILAPKSYPNRELDIQIMSVVLLEMYIFAHIQAIYIYSPTLTHHKVRITKVNNPTVFPPPALSENIDPTSSFSELPST